MRGDLAAALLYQPPTLYLDEPTVGLDVLARETVRTFIEEINRENKTTVMLTTHDLADVERLCRRILLIDQGRILYDGSAQGLVDTNMRRIATCWCCLRPERAQPRTGGKSGVSRVSAKKTGSGASGS